MQTPKPGQKAMQKTVKIDEIKQICERNQDLIDVFRDPNDIVYVDDTKYKYLD